MTDAELIFATAHAPTAQQENISTHVYDTGPLATGNAGVQDLGASEDLYLEIIVGTTVTSGGAATVDFRFFSHSTTTITSGTLHTSTGAIAKATLVAGYVKRLKLPREGYGRYIGVSALIAVADLTAGAFKYHLRKGVARAPHHASDVSFG